MNLTEHTEFRLSGKRLRDYIRTHLLVCSLAVILQPHQGLAQQNSDTAKTSVQHTPIPRDGRHDFDFEIGTVSRFLVLKTAFHSCLSGRRRRGGASHHHRLNTGRFSAMNVSSDFGGAPPIF